MNMNKKQSKENETQKRIRNRKGKRIKTQKRINAKRYRYRSGVSGLVPLKFKAIFI